MKNKRILFVCCMFLFLFAGRQTHAALAPQCGSAAEYYVPAYPFQKQGLIYNKDFAGVIVDNVPPTANLCKVGHVAAPVAKGKFNPLFWGWTCYNDFYVLPGTNQSAITSCSVHVYSNAKCGSAADGLPSAVRPTTNLCETGSIVPNAYDGQSGWTKDSLSPVGVYRSIFGTKDWQWICQKGTEVTTGVACKLQGAELNNCASTTCTPATAPTPSQGKCWNNAAWVPGTVNCIDNGCAANTCEGQPCFNGAIMVEGTKTTDECVAPTGLTATCNAAGDAVTLKWNTVFGATGYNLRVDNTMNTFFTPGTDTYIDSYVGNIFARPVVKSRTYNWWVNATKGTNYSPLTLGTFNCTCTSSCVAADPASMCVGQTAGGGDDGCGGTCPVINGTKTDGVCCIDTTWIPDASTQCSGTPLTQASNCGNTQEVSGTKDCGVRATNWKEINP